MERRDFFQHVTALAIGVTGAAGLDLDRLTALLPHAEPTGTRHLGVADVEAIEQATATFRRQDFTHGSGLAHDTAVDHLRATLPTVSFHPVSASTSCLLAGIQARAHAVQGDAAGCDRALGQATEHRAAIDPATAPPWTAYLSATGVPGHHGCARYTLALPDRDPHAAGRAVLLLLRDALDSFGPGYNRLTALYLPDLAGAHALAGDPDIAVSIGHRAVDAVTTLRSPRAYDRLRVLNTALEPLHDSAGVAELRNRLSTTVA